MNQKYFLEHDWYPEPLPENVEVGARSWIYSSFAFLHCQSRQACAVKIGNDSGIYAGTFFDLGPNATVEIGNYCTLVGAIINTNRPVKIHDYTFIAHEVVIADSPFSIPLRDGSKNKSNDIHAIIELGENSWIGANSVLLAGARIGKGAVVGAGTILDFEVPDYAIVAGNPAKIRGWVKNPELNEG